ncbi:MAG TPA: FkbM family methyltransferase [Caulobacteraceae bacterium]|nr:FkbM family methyltransferase [Caulobacteraceae bacterium]
MASAEVLENLTKVGVVRDDLIFDVGMNACEDTDYFLAKGFEVVAVDANPAVCRAAEKRYAAEIASGRLTVLNRAISLSREPLTFWVCTSYSAWSTASPKLRDFWSAQGATFEEIEVQGATTADVVEAHGVPYYAKIDIEGYDLICLKGFAPDAAPTYASVEVDLAAVDELLSTAEALGYRRFELRSQSKVPEQRPPVPALEGASIDYRFEVGSSGLFGREITAEWLDAATLRARCRRIIDQHRLGGALTRVASLTPFGEAAADFKRKRLPLSNDWYDVHMRR